jgi:N utilization substance protein B
MISRRLIRLKVLKVLYGYILTGGTALDVALKELQHSIAKTYELYQSLLLLPVEVGDYAARVADAGRQKQRPSDEERSPNTKFIDNSFIQLLRQTPALKTFAERHKFTWAPDVVKNLFLQLKSTNYYQQYMHRHVRSFFEDKMLIIRMMESEIEDNEDIYAAIEEQSIYWVDEEEFTLSHALRTFKKFAADGHNTLLKIYKDKSDEDFALRLLSTAISNHDEFRTIITQNTQNWDIERIAFMDIVLMIAAMAELMACTEVPVSVTLNEYIEISKYYSTANSSVFINGVLDHIATEMTNNNQIIKEGRGLTAIETTTGSDADSSEITNNDDT